MQSTKCMRPIRPTTDHSVNSLLDTGGCSAVFNRQIHEPADQLMQDVTVHTIPDDGINSQMHLTTSSKPDIATENDEGLRSSCHQSRMSDEKCLQKNKYRNPVDQSSLIDNCVDIVAPPPISIAQIWNSKMRTDIHSNGQDELTSFANDDDEHNNANRFVQHRNARCVSVEYSEEQFGHPCNVFMDHLNITLNTKLAAPLWSIIGHDSARSSILQQLPSLVARMNTWQLASGTPIVDISDGVPLENQRCDVMRNSPLIKLPTSQIFSSPLSTVGSYVEPRLKLEAAELWMQFSHLTTEMVITKSGRRMFPALKFNVYGLRAADKYCFLLDIVPVDNFRYKFHDSQWTVAGRSSENSSSDSWSRSGTFMWPTCYIHPESPALGEVWMSKTLSFHRLKLTNNVSDMNGHVVLHSMHRYQPRVHLVRLVDGANAKSDSKELIKTFIFPETQFIAVTAYQNNKVKVSSH